MTYTTSDYGTRRVAWQECIEGCCVKFGMAYCYPSQKTILSNGLRYHQVKCSLRTLNRDLKKMEKEGCFRRKRRLTAKIIKTGKFMSTLYKLTQKAFIFAKRKAKWCNKLFSLSRLPNLANHKSQRENEILKEASGNVGILWNSAIKGKPSPVSLHG